MASFQLDLAVVAERESTPGHDRLPAAASRPICTSIEDDDLSHRDKPQQGGPACGPVRMREFLDGAFIRSDHQRSSLILMAYIDFRITILRYYRDAGQHAGNPKRMAHAFAAGSKLQATGLRRRAAARCAISPGSTAPAARSTSTTMEVPAPAYG